MKKSMPSQHFPLVMHFLAVEVQQFYSIFMLMTLYIHFTNLIRRKKIHTCLKELPCHLPLLETRALFQQSLSYHCLPHPQLSLPGIHLEHSVDWRQQACYPVLNSKMVISKLVIISPAIMIT